MKTTRGISILAAMAAVALAASAAAAQAPAASAVPAKHETMKQLKAEAKVTEKAARATALAQVPGGKVTKHELERENGKLLYSFDITTKGKTGIDEVQVDAVTGAVLSNKHETPAMEKAEAAADAKAHVARKAHKKAKAEKKA
ncbi:MAG: PepSY domain-containing protein [Gemmatimonadales bacterium]